MQVKNYDSDELKLKKNEILEMAKATNNPIIQDALNC